MNNLLYVVVALSAAVLFVLICLFALALFIKFKAFGSRCDKNPLLKYYTAEDFNLAAKTINIAEPRKSQYVRAVLYKKEGVGRKDGLIIFCHGMGPGHVAYTTEIAYFCNLGYTVLAPDYWGCNLSDGKSIKSFKKGVDGVLSAVYYAETNLGYSRIMLVGHSWGAYSALCAAARAGKSVNKVVAISAPDKPEKAVQHELSGRIPAFLCSMLKPFISMICGGESAARAAEECSAQVLLVQGDSDTVVPADNSALNCAAASNIRKFVAKGKGHNPYNTVAAEEKLASLSAALAVAKDKGVEFFKNFDYAAATEEDESVMAEIAGFLAKT